MLTVSSLNVNFKKTKAVYDEQRVMQMKKKQRSMSLILRHLKLLQEKLTKMSARADKNRPTSAWCG